MAKNPSKWSNNDIKPATNWAPVTKQKSVWANNVTKNPAKFTPVAKSTDVWGINYQPAQTYFYNDTNMTYNNPYVQFNHLLNQNQLNQRAMTRWAVVV